MQISHIASISQCLAFASRSSQLRRQNWLVWSHRLFWAEPPYIVYAISAYQHMEWHGCGRIVDVSQVGFGPPYACIVSICHLKKTVSRFLRNFGYFGCSQTLSNFRSDSQEYGKAYTHHEWKMAGVWGSDCYSSARVSPFYSLHLHARQLPCNFWQLSISLQIIDNLFA